MRGMPSSKVWFTSTALSRLESKIKNWLVANRRDRTSASIQDEATRSSYIDHPHMASSDLCLRTKFRNDRTQLLVNVAANGRVDPLKLANQYRVVRFGQQFVC